MLFSTLDIRGKLTMTYRKIISRLDTLQMLDMILFQFQIEKKTFFLISYFK
jgi:hypothetical protein